MFLILHLLVFHHQNILSQLPENRSGWSFISRAGWFGERSSRKDGKEFFYHSSLYFGEGKKRRQQQKSGREMEMYKRGKLCIHVWRVQYKSSQQGGKNISHAYIVYVYESNINCNVLNILSRFFMPFFCLFASVSLSLSLPASEGERSQAPQKRHWRKLNFPLCSHPWWLRLLPSYAPPRINHMNVRHYFSFTSYCLIQAGMDQAAKDEAEEKDECIKKIKIIKNISNFSCFYFSSLVRRHVFVVVYLVNLR